MYRDTIRRIQEEGQQSSTWRLRLLTLVMLSFCSIIGYMGLLHRKEVWGYARDSVCESPKTPAYLATLQGRIDQDFPSPRCCVDHDCLVQDKGRYAILTTLRSDDYLPLLEHLSCSIQHSNPGATLIVATVEGDLSIEVSDRVKSLTNVQLHLWKEFRIVNTLRSRFALNWVKLRAWEMDEYDMILMIDTDTLVLKDVSHLFKLPIHFATVLDQDKNYANYAALGRQQGGVVLLRPCKAVAQHMMQLVSSNSTLQFSHSHAEQSFLDWYFRYDRWNLPIKYNAISHLLKDYGDHTAGGTAPVIVHYSVAKHYSMDLDPGLHHEQVIAMGCGKVVKEGQEGGQEVLQKR